MTVILKATSEMQNIIPLPVHVFYCLENLIVKVNVRFCTDLTPCLCAWEDFRFNVTSHKKLIFFYFSVESCFQYTPCLWKTVQCFEKKNLWQKGYG